MEQANYQQLQQQPENNPEKAAVCQQNRIQAGSRQDHGQEVPEILKQDF